MMKKINLKVATCLLAGMFLCSSCFVGSYGLWNKYINWQTHMSDSKFLNAIVGFFLVPIVGSVTTLVDVLVLNTIEFWSGDNPMAHNVGKTKSIIGQDGRLYAVKTLKDGYEVTDSEGNITLFTHKTENDSWWITQNGETREIFRFNGDSKSIKMVLNGENQDFSLNETGVLEAQMAACNGLYFAAR